MKAGIATERWWIFLSVVGLAYFAGIVFMPLIIAVFFAMLLWPAVAWLSGKGLPRSLSCFLITFLFLVSISLVGWLFFYSASSVTSSLPEYSQRIGELLTRFRSAASAFEKNSAHAMAGLSGTAGAQKVQIVEALPSWSGLALRGAGSFSEFVSLALFVPLLLLYFLLDKENLLESANALLGNYSYLPKLHSEIPRMIRSFVGGNLIAWFIMTVLQSSILFFLGYSNWASLGLLSGFLNLVPLIGAPLAVLLPLCQAAIQFHEAYPFLVMAGTFVLLHFLTNNILIPKLVGAQTNVNSATMVLGLLFWSWLWGAGGFLLAIPMTSLVKIFLESHADTVPLANLMSARPRFVVKSPGRVDRD